MLMVMMRLLRGNDTVVEMGGVRWKRDECEAAKGGERARNTHKRGIANNGKEHQILFVDFHELNYSRTKICPHGKRPATNGKIKTT